MVTDCPTAYMCVTPHCHGNHGALRQYSCASYIQEYYGMLQKLKIELTKLTITNHVQVFAQICKGNCPAKVPQELQCQMYLG